MKTDHELQGNDDPDNKCNKYGYLHGHIVRENLLPKNEWKRKSADHKESQTVIEDDDETK